MVNLANDEDSRFFAIDWRDGTEIDLAGRMSTGGWIALRSGQVDLNLYHLPGSEPMYSIALMHEDLWPISLEWKDFPHHQYAGVSSPWTKPIWSPVEPIVAFIGAVDDTWLSVYTFDVRTEEMKRVSMGEQALVLDWSPDGRYLVYVIVDDIDSQGYRPQEIRVLDTHTDGIDARIWAMGQHPLEVVGWISSEAFLVSERRPDGSYSRLMLMDVRMGEREVIFHEGFLSAADVPEHRTLALTQAQGPEGSIITLISMNLDGEIDLKEISVDGEIGAVRWYPTIQRFASESLSGVHLFDVGGEMLQAFPRERGLPSLSPDDRWLAFGPSETFYDSRLRVYALDGAHMLETDMRVRDVAWWSDSSGLIYLKSVGGIGALDLSTEQIRQYWFGDGWDIELLSSPSTSITEYLAGKKPIEAPPDRSAASTGTPGPTPMLDTVLGTGAELTIVQIEMQDAHRGWGLGRGIGDRFDRVLITENGGATWRDITPPKDPTPSQDDLGARAYGDVQDAVLFAMDADQAWVTYEAPTGGWVVVWKTVDAGQTWTASAALSIYTLRDHGPWVDGYKPIAMDFIDDQYGWIQAITEIPGMMMAADYVLLRSEDGGRRWDFIADSGTCGPEGLVFLDRDHGWLAETCDQPEWSQVLKSEDGGEFWYDEAEVRVGLDQTPFGGEEHCWGAYELERLPGGWIKMVVWCPEELRYPLPSPGEAQNLLYLSQDLGVSWRTERLPSGVQPDGALSTDFINADVGWFLDGTGGVLYQTADGGSTWRTLKQVAWEGELHFIDPIHGWAVVWERGASGSDRELSLVRTLDGGYTWELLEATVR
jgi:hypothetical protein